MKSKPLTVIGIARELQNADKPLSIRSIYLNLKAVGVKPISKLQQRPQLYPPDAAQRILERYGLA